MFSASLLGFSVVGRGRSCSEYRWDIKWDNKPGDQPLLGLSAGDLIADNVKIAATELTSGGTWIRPLRGDMLRLPETEPQVCMYSWHMLC